MHEEIERLILVFRADSGAFSAFLDSAKKLMRLKSCSLCQITHGLAGERPEWQRYKAELGLPIDYLHLDEITPQIADAIAGRTPSVVAATDGRLEQWLGPEQIESCRGSVSALKNQIESQAARRGARLKHPTGASK